LAKIVNENDIQRIFQQSRILNETTKQNMMKKSSTGENGNKVTATLMGCAGMVRGKTNLGLETILTSRSRSIFTSPYRFLSANRDKISTVQKHCMARISSISLSVEDTPSSVRSTQKDAP